MFSVPVCPPVSFGMFIMLGWWSLERPLKLSNVGKLCQTSQLFRVFHSQTEILFASKKIKKEIWLSVEKFRRCIYGMALLTATQIESITSGGWDRLYRLYRGTWLSSLLINLAPHTFWPFSLCLASVGFWIRQWMCQNYFCFVWEKNVVLLFYVFHRKISIAGILMTRSPVIWWLLFYFWEWVCQTWHVIMLWHKWG